MHTDKVTLHLKSSLTLEGEKISPTAKSELYLFGSQRAHPRGDSDWDFVLNEPSLLLHLPRPFPVGVENFCVTSPVDYHRQLSEWSKFTWRSLGGERVISSIREEVSTELENRCLGFIKEKLDLFLYVPPDIDSDLWGIRLAWNDVFLCHDMIEFDRYQRLSQGRAPHPLADGVRGSKDPGALHKTIQQLKEEADCPIPDDYHSLSSLGFILRDGSFDFEDLQDITGLE